MESVPITFGSGAFRCAYAFSWYRVSAVHTMSQQDDAPAVSLMRKTLKREGVVFRGSNYAAEVQKQWRSLSSEKCGAYHALAGMPKASYQKDIQDYWHLSTWRNGCSAQRKAPGRSAPWRTHLLEEKLKRAAAAPVPAPAPTAAPPVGFQGTWKWYQHG